MLETRQMLPLLLAAAFISGCSSLPATDSDAGPRPLIVAHRAGAADFPENTLLAIDNALRNGVDMLWLTVQLSRDDVPVLYRPADLSANTPASGAVSEKTLAQLQTLNAGWNFKQTAADGQVTFPHRSQAATIPSLQQALAAIPGSVPVILDMKALPAAPQAKAVAQVLEQLHAWNRVLIYSTDASYQQAFAHYPQARLFESRDDTRDRLASVALAHSCTAPPAPASWAAFEYRRPVQLVETFTLGEARSKVDARLWTPAAVDCFQSRGKVRMLAIGINTAEDYQAAACLKMDAVLVDSPRAMREVKQRLERPLRCN
ncbi:glycerophosphodiester phosphodiesterase family protein [Pseudomonas chlororaphis]|uniref:glycerophosphodiester phosphodiesterase family protein n=1 Tax=Pseudomonas chlororaphis TaxID=587753 RepID=UPI0023668D4E|nr:glycerophosphodiester phosphodiesterase family protein [Pseudomonas chlororaphis]WDG53641.1 glycerophosphodiester phosphodiesterase family protein [Pseudomonas chlororaphis]WDH91158.1 glycerophosphodiester phosphodiesterase family protein [Pseudomonas chlororaphis]